MSKMSSKQSKKEKAPEKKAQGTASAKSHKADTSLARASGPKRGRSNDGSEISSRAISEQVKGRKGPSKTRGKDKDSAAGTAPKTEKTTAPEAAAKAPDVKAAAPAAEATAAQPAPAPEGSAKAADVKDPQPAAETKAAPPAGVPRPSHWKDANPAAETKAAEAPAAPTDAAKPADAKDAKPAAETKTAEAPAAPTDAAKPAEAKDAKPATETRVAAPAAAQEGAGNATELSDAEFVTEPAAETAPKKEATETAPEIEQPPVAENLRPPAPPVSRFGRKTLVFAMAAAAGLGGLGLYKLGQQSAGPIQENKQTTPGTDEPKPEQKPAAQPVTPAEQEKKTHEELFKQLSAKKDVLDTLCAAKDAPAFMQIAKWHVEGSALVTFPGEKAEIDSGDLADRFKNPGTASRQDVEHLKKLNVILQDALSAVSRHQ